MLAQRQRADGGHLALSHPSARSNSMRALLGRTSSAQPGTRVVQAEVFQIELQAGIVTQ